MTQNPVAERNQLLLNQTSACAFCRVSLQPWEASSQRGCLQEPRVGMRALGPAYEGQVLLYSSSQTLWGLTSPTAVHIRLTKAVLNLRVSICRMDSTYNHLFSITYSKYKLVKQFASTCFINNSQMTIEVKDKKIGSEPPWVRTMARCLTDWRSWNVVLLRLLHLSLHWIGVEEQHWSTNNTREMHFLINVKEFSLIDPQTH